MRGGQPVSRKSAGHTDRVADFFFAAYGGETQLFAASGGGRRTAQAVGDVQGNKVCCKGAEGQGLNMASVECGRTATAKSAAGSNGSD